MNIAITYGRLKNWKRAIAVYSEILSRGLGDVGVLHNLSLTHLDARQVRQAVLWEIRALRTLPRHLRHYSYLAYLFLRLHRLGYATRFAREETRRDPTDFNPHLLLSRIAQDRFAATGEPSALTDTQIHLVQANALPRSPSLAIKTASVFHRLYAKYRPLWRLAKEIQRILEPLIPKWDPASDIVLSLLGGSALVTAIVASVLQSFVITLVALLSVLCVSIVLGSILFLFQLTYLLVTVPVFLLAYKRLKITLRSAVSEIQIPTDYPARGTFNQLESAQSLSGQRLTQR